MSDKWNLEGVSVDSNNNLVAAGTVVVPTYTVATIPAKVAGGIIYVSNGAAGSPILAFSDGTDWLRSDTGAAVSAS